MAQRVSIQDRFEVVRKNVEDILLRFPECRRDNFTLVLRYWKEFDGVNIKIPVEVRDALTRYETIIRRKQEIQKDQGKYKSGIPSPHKYKDLSKVFQGGDL